MRKAKKSDDMRPEYLIEDLGKGVRGKYVEAYRAMSKPREVYFKKDDILHYVISEEPEANSVEVSPNITAELNDKGELIGIEILNAGDFISDTVLESIQAKIEDFPDQQIALDRLTDKEDKLISDEELKKGLYNAGMRKSILKGIRTPVSKCSRKLRW